MLKRRCQGALEDEDRDTSEPTATDNGAGAAALRDAGPAGHGCGWMAVGDRQVPLKLEALTPKVVVEPDKYSTYKSLASIIHSCRITLSQVVEFSNFN